MRFKANFADNVTAYVENVTISYTYIHLIEGRFSSASISLLQRLEERVDLIESGKLKGVYCFKPDWMDESEVWGPEWGLVGKCLKDNIIKAKVNMPEDKGQYTIELEWYQSTNELSETPLVELVQRAVSKLKYKDIKKYCRLIDWGSLS
jgi:hypothetical protein